METALISLVCVAILLIGTVTTVFTSFQAATTVSDSLKQMEVEAAEFRRTEINTIINNYSDPIRMWVENNGQTNIGDFDKWDIIAQYSVSGIDYSTYLTRGAGPAPGANEWVLQGIYLMDGNNEVFDPGILNPDEQARVDILLSPVLPSNNTVRFTTSTENGVTAQCQIRR
jgi:hypothetical protein